jgi:hypothetical protein
MATNQKNELEKSQRVKRIMDMMGQGMYMYEIIPILSKEWNCSDRSVYKYMSKVKEILSKSISKDVDELLNKFNTLYSLALKRGDIKTANSILQNIGKFTVGEKQSIEHSGGLDINITINENKPTSDTSI